MNIAPDGLRTVGGPAIEYCRLFDSALYLQKNGQYEKSAAEWRRVLDISPNDAVAHKNLGMTLLETGRVEEAITNFRKAAELKPGFAPALSNLGRALTMTGRLDEALVQLKKASESDSRYAPAYYNLGLVFAKRGDTDEAIRQWQKALEINPNYAEVYGSLGDALHAGGKTAEALAHWRDVIRLQPNDASALRQVAWVLATSADGSIRNGSEAVALAVRAVQLSAGKDPMILDTLAAAYAEAGRFEEAVLTECKALALAEQNHQEAQAAVLRSRITLYEAKTPLRVKPVKIWSFMINSVQ